MTAERHIIGRQPRSHTPPSSGELDSLGRHEMYNTLLPDSTSQSPQVPLAVTSHRPVWRYLCTWATSAHSAEGTQLLSVLVCRGEGRNFGVRKTRFPVVIRINLNFLRDTLDSLTLLQTTGSFYKTVYSIRSQFSSFSLL